MSYKLYKGQKAIRIIRAEANKDNPYIVANRAAEQKAMKTLQGSAFKVWCYLRDNKNEYEFALTSIDVCPKCGISKPTYLAAVRELEAKQYLIPVELSSEVSGYLFLESGE